MALANRHILFPLPLSPSPWRLCRVLFTFYFPFTGRDDFDLTSHYENSGVQSENKGEINNVYQWKMFIEFSNYGGVAHKDPASWTNLNTYRT